MRNAWEHVYVVPHDPGARKQSHRKHHMIDDWYVPQVSDITNRILKIWKIDVCLANYVWFSRWLEDVPTGIPKYLDTHDMFANRDLSLKKAGIDGRWYSTTPAEEAKAFKRADTVLAIQDSEAEKFRKATKQPVLTLGHYLPAQFLAQKPLTKGQKLKVGYLASSNPINQHSLHHFNIALKANPQLQEMLSFHLAGAICASDTARDTLFEKLGFVESVTSFYEEMDVVLNPNLGGTGLKIKSVEALSFGKPLVATADAMVGIASAEPFHQCKNMTALTKALMALAREPELLTALQDSGQAAFARYASAQRETLDRLFPKQNTEAMKAEPPKEEAS